MVDLHDVQHGLGVEVAGGFLGPRVLGQQCGLLVGVDSPTVFDGVARGCLDVGYLALLADFIAQVKQRVGKLLLFGQPQMERRLNDGFDLEIDAIPGLGAMASGSDGRRHRIGQEASSQSVDMGPVNPK